MRNTYCLAGAFLLAGLAGAQTGYNVTQVVDQAQDRLLVNPWGLTRPGNPSFKENQWWVADNGTGFATLYFANQRGSKSLAPLVISIPAANGSGTGSPTGMAFSNKDVAFATLDGTISNWSAFTPGTGKESCSSCHVTHATIMINHAAEGASYEGLTVANHTISGAPTYYAANVNGGVEAYDAASFSPVRLPPGAFTDRKIPAGYTPAGIQALGSKIYVAYDLRTGGGTGFVDAYDTEGKLLMRLENGRFNRPWGIAEAPAGFGPFSHMLLVGNTGSGWIGAYDPATG